MEVTGPTQAPQGASSAINLSNTFDDFLKLLTTQLKNQDPLSPLDTNQFTEQLVQFSGVEQAINTNMKLDQLIALQGGAALATALPYVGTTVEIASDQIVLNGGRTLFSYQLAGAAAEVSVQIVDGLGRIVREFAGPTAAGRHELAWDGLDDLGSAVADGTYGLNVIALDSEGATVPAATTVIGHVTGAHDQDGTIMLDLGGLELPLSAVIAIRESPNG